NGRYAAVKWVCPHLRLEFIGIALHVGNLNQSTKGTNKMSLSAQFKTDTAKEAEGVAIEYGANADGTNPTFWISRMSKANVFYTKTLDQKTRKYRKAMELGTLANDIAEKVFLDVFVTAVLKGWENIALSDVTGNPDDEGYAPFTAENAMKLLTNLPELYTDLQEQAKSASAFKTEQLEAETKN
ncbi:TPA: hypothetical protein NNP44_004649, partial [Salmonella enterica]|nr:hypothetical protein [Salmonella enterica]